MTTNKSRATKTIATVIIGLVVAGGLNSAYAQVSTANPSWTLSGSRSYEESNPGAGTSQTFSSSYGGSPSTRMETSAAIGSQEPTIPNSPGSF